MGGVVTGAAVVVGRGAVVAGRAVVDGAAVVGGAVVCAARVVGGALPPIGTWVSGGDVVVAPNRVVVEPPVENGTV